MYAKLAITNAKKSIKDYLIYFITITLCVSLFYAFISISSSEYQFITVESYNFDMLKVILKYATYIITALLVILIGYVNKYMMKRRQREFATYILLGTEQKSVALMFFIETLIISIPSASYVLYLIHTGESAVLRGDNFITALLVCGGIVTTLPLLGFSYSAQILHLSTLGILQYITPTIAFLLGVFVYHEYFSTNMLITFILIWTGLVIYSVDGIYQLKKSMKEHK